MVFPHRTSILIYLVIFALVLGCSGDGGETPTSPDLADDVLTGKVIQSSASDVYIWEAGEVLLDIEKMEAEIVPLRTTDFTLNVVMFLQPPKGDPSNLTVAFDIPGSDFPNAFVDLDLTLSHPFPGTDFWGFDTRCIVFAGGSEQGKQDPSLTYPTASELRIVNADGYTRWFNNQEFGPFNKIFGYVDGIMAPTFTMNFSLVNGFKYFCENIDRQATPADPPEADRGVFSGGAVTREMLIQFPQIAQPFKFKYSVATAWDAPTTSPPTSVDHFPATANAQEAYQIVVTQDPASDAFYDETGPSWGGDLILDIEVWDWQAEGDAAAQILEIWVESPTLLATQGDAVEITGTWTQSAGSSANSVVYSGTLTNVTPAAVEGQELFITVVSEDPTSYEPPLPGFLYPDAPLAAYQLFGCYIEDNGSVVPSITVVYPNGAETLVIGDPATILWSSTGPIADVIIEYNTDGSESLFPNTITLSTPNTGSYDWDPVPDTPSTTCHIRISDVLGTASDISDDVWEIGTEGDTGWNVKPGLGGIIVDNPAPNQSTYSPDFGIQNDGLGNEGAWLIDQEGGIPDGTPLFYDYMLDWSGPGGNTWPSGFNFNPAPMGPFDASSNGIALFGSCANTGSINPPIYNDPFTAIWYIFYLLDDGGLTAGDLMFATWGDAGEGDPPGDDPEEQPWYHTADISGGLPGWQGVDMDNAATWLMMFSTDPAMPPPLEEDEGDLNVGFWQYDAAGDGYATGGIYRLGFPEYTTYMQPPLFEAFDISDPDKCRIAADSDSYLTFDSALDNLAVMVYMLDSLGNWYGSGYQLDWAASMFYYIGLGNSMKMRPEYADDLYLEGGTMVDLEMLPTITYLYDQDWELGNNWVAVLYDMGDGTWVVQIYKVDWGADEPEDEIIIIDTTDPLPGTPIAIDVDAVNFEIHVLADNGGDIEATVFDYTE